MSEYLEFKGWLLEQQNKVVELRLKMHSLRETIRMKLTLLEDIERLDTTTAAALAVELADKQITLKAMQAEIAAKKKAFGEV